MMSKQIQDAYIVAADPHAGRQGAQGVIPQHPPGRNAGARAARA
jgi:hypothetical protein